MSREITNTRLTLGARQGLGSNVRPLMWQLSCSPPLHSDLWPSNTVTLTSCRGEETGWLTPGMWTVRSKPYDSFWFASSKTFVLMCNGLIGHTKHRGEWPLVYLFVAHAGAAFVPPRSSWNAESVSWKQQTLTRTEQSRVGLGQRETETLLTKGFTEHWLT